MKSTELTNQQRAGAVWRTATSLRVLLSGAFFAVLSAWIFQTSAFMWPVAIGYVALMSWAAWRSGAAPHDKKPVDVRVKQENEDS